MRVKTDWFNESGGREPADVATVLAATLWRLADRLVDNLSRAGYAIVTPERGFRILAEVVAFGLHLCDRRAYAAWPLAERAALLQSAGTRVADIMEENLRALGAAAPQQSRAEFVALLNKRADEYADFELPASGASFAALRHLASQIRELMEQSDQPWVMDQVMDIELPELLMPLNKTLDGLVAPRAATD